MATGTFTYNALRTKTLKERIKTQRKIAGHSNSTRAMLNISIVYSRYLFSYGGFTEALVFHELFLKRSTFQLPVRSLKLSEQILKNIAVETVENSDVFLRMLIPFVVLLRGIVVFPDCLGPGLRDVSVCIFSKLKPARLD